MISEEMYEVMLHMIGYGGDLSGNFIDAIHVCDNALLLELANKCNERWGGNTVNVELIKKNIELTRRNKNE